MLLAPAPAAAARPWDDEMVPDGAWLHDWALEYDEQDRAWDRAGNLKGLKSYLLSSRTLRNQTTGEVTRTATRLELGFTYGLSDSWNLRAGLPYLNLEQKSGLETGSGDPLRQAEVESFDDQRLSGLGDLTLISLHRPIFDDRHGFIWGYGVRHPLQPRDARPGPRALALRSPNPSFLGLLHYTRYLLGRGGRVDLRAELELGIDGEIETFDGRTQPYRRGNQFEIDLGLARDFGPVTAGMGYSERRQVQDRLDGVGQEDPEVERLLLVRLGIGNLERLEERPVAFPYQFLLEFERTLEGFNVIYRNDVTLVFRYFL